MVELLQKPGSLGVNLPLVVDEITPQWLTEALSLGTPGLEVVGVEIVDVVWGTASKVRIAVEYAKDPGPSGPPTTLCVKGGFDERVREALGAAGDYGMRLEACFFRDMAGSLNLTLPRAWFADCNDVQGVLILEDLGLAGEFGTPTKAWKPEIVAAALNDLAHLHADTWNKEFPDLDWVTNGAGPVRAAAQSLFSEAHWIAYFAAPDAPLLPEVVNDRARNMRGYEALWAYDDAAQKALTHGDAHLGNTYITPNGEPVFLDWAGVARCPWSYDVAYFLVGALSIEDRRNHERSLVEGYLDSLEKHGGPTLDRAEAWLDYRRHTLHGLIWATLPAVMQTPENVRAMGDRYVAAIVDHDPLTILGV